MRSALGNPAVLIDLATMLRVEPVDHQVLRQALALGWRDFEDAVQAVTAARCQADYLVTRNPRDFRQSLVPVSSPAERLAMFARACAFPTGVEFGRWNGT